MPDHLLSIRASLHYGQKSVLRNVCLDVALGEVLGIVGQSGCGKSSLALAVLGLLKLKGGRAAGTLRFRGTDLLTLGESEFRKLRGKDISLVLQSPMSALNPALRIGTQLREAWNLHASTSREERKRAIQQALTDVSLPSDDEFLRRMPSQLSVGQAQRVLIGMSILHRPSLLIADEPTSALDAITASEILKLFSELNQRLGMSILFISHDLPSVANLCHRVAIVHEGEIVELDTPARIFSVPKHPYTQQLVSALPKVPALLSSAAAR
jgi:ABC-type dipeptide/oligopeptide/nickel transport system ATPase component